MTAGMKNIRILSMWKSQLFNMIDIAFLLFEIKLLAIFSGSWTEKAEDAL